MVMAAIAVEYENAPGAEKLCNLLVDGGAKSCWLNVLQARIALLRQDQESAREFAKQASNIGTQDPHIANQLGVILSRTGWHREALAPLRVASEGVPENADYRHNLAVALQFNGLLEEAEIQFRELVLRHLAHAKGWLALVQLAKSPDAGWQQALEAQFSVTNDTEDRLLLGHAIARLAENNKEWDESLTWLGRAKEQKRGEVAHDRSSAESLASAAIESIEAQVISRGVSGDERPLFIVGMPRSGTTLVERILTSHTGVVSVGELSDFAIILKRALGTSGPLVLDPEVLSAAANEADLSKVGEDYVRRASVLAGDANRFIDKMPFNSFFVPAILRALPGARVICLRRSPHDLLFANYRQLFATGFSYYSYAYDFADTAHFIAQFERLADAYEAALPPDRFLAIRYEDVIAEQRAKTEQLLAFAGLDWEDACMEFHRNSDPVATASSVQVRSPLYSSSIGQWRRYADGGSQAHEEFEKYGIHAAAAPVD
ncbi:MAG TPA: protein-tyrosine sulfotransferase [Erythrobacter sp.]|nr:protein-tyrosine sulfotransferase [Erythrobacter sp.]